ncbi:MAG: hypothetical protein M1825_004616 [Sarcosagium campestre]|nr:MAG: hypothetical protein M1825_004616 [Sarcosagium campestre]
MDPIIQREVDKLDPAIPFRAKSGHHHHTWARTFHSHPELYIRPQSTAEIQKIVTLARRCRRRVTLVGCGHSPSDITCTSSWLVNLDDYSSLISVHKGTGVVVMQAGIRLHDLNKQLESHGLTMPNLGSIDEQAIAGAISTGTHGSSLRHGLLSESVLALRLMLANGRSVACSASQNPDLFRAALVSLGALGIITDVTFRAVPTFNIHWTQSLRPFSEILSTWSPLPSSSSDDDTSLWTQAEFVRVWWLPYTRAGIVWTADKTDAAPTSPVPPPDGPPKRTIGYHAYQAALYLAHYIPRLLPLIERLVATVQYGLSDHSRPSTGVSPSRTGLLMDCLYSQFVNEWSLPLDKGPEALTRLSAWIHHEPFAAHGIPVDSTGIWVHAPMEVRVSNTSRGSTSSSPPSSSSSSTATSTTNTIRPFLDNSVRDGPTLFLNATLYRPYGQDPPCRVAYYKAFEFLMLSLGGKPHWAKNFDLMEPNVDSYTDSDSEKNQQPRASSTFSHMYNDELIKWRAIRNDVDPEGMFIGPWHRRYLLNDAPSSDDASTAQNVNDTYADDADHVDGDDKGGLRVSSHPLPLEERRIARAAVREGGWEVYGIVNAELTHSAIPPATRDAAAGISGDGGGGGVEESRVRREGSQESFDVVYEGEAAASIVLHDD